MGNDTYGREMEVKPDAADLADKLDREKAKTGDKLAWICDKAKEITGQDPRGGGWSFVAHPQVIQQMLVDFANASERRLQRPVVIGEHDGDVVFWWQDIPVRVRHMAKFPDVHLVPTLMLVRERPSDQADRRAAAELRMAANKGEIRVVQ
jgi:hypothetical protein